MHVHGDKNFIDCKKRSLLRFNMKSFLTAQIEYLNVLLEHLLSVDDQ